MYVYCKRKVKKKVRIYFERNFERKIILLLSTGGGERRDVRFLCECKVHKKRTFFLLLRALRPDNQEVQGSRLVS